MSWITRNLPPISQGESVFVSMRYTAENLMQEGNDFLIKNDPSRAREAYQKALELLLPQGEKHATVAECLDRIGVAYSLLNETAEALQSHQRAQAIWSTLPGDTCLKRGNNLLLIGECLKKLGEFQKALVHLEEAHEIFRHQTNQQDLMASTLKLRGEIFLGLSELPKALNDLRAALEIFSHLHNDDHISVKSTKEALAKVYIMANFVALLQDLEPNASETEH